MNETEVAFAGIARQAEMLRAGEITSSELVGVYLERIDRINPRLNAFTDVFAEDALASARQADERLADGGATPPLLGVPVALKDELEVEGLVARHGTDAYDDPADADCAHWARLKEAGAILLGKTTLPELAICGFTETEVYGETRNPWNTGHTTGGSSGGSGAAVAAGLVGAASASDGAGSIRIPAGMNCLFGLKPQRGRVSLAPHAEHWLGMSVTGCLSRRVADTALWLDIAAGPEPIDAHTPPPSSGTYLDAAGRDPGSLRIAWTTEAPRAVAPPLSDPEVDEAVEGLAAMLAELGHSVANQAPEWGGVGDDMAVMYLKGIESDYDTVPHPERLEKRTRGFKLLGRAIPGALLARARDREQLHRERIEAIFEEFDILITPTAATPPVEIGRWAGQNALRTLIGMGRVYPFTAPWNYLGNPTAAIPIGMTAGGLPLSAQLIGPPNSEELLISLAAQLEHELAWPDQVPPLAA